MSVLINESCDFFMVWTKTGHKPRKVHATREIAEAEAARLAGLNPGKKFIVLHAYTKVVAQVTVEPVPEAA
jgi:hypothetical protein